MEAWGAALYGDPCRECGFDWSIAPPDGIRWVETLPERLTDATRHAQGAERRAHGGWSVTEYICHIGDNLRQWSERIQCARLSGSSAVAGYDPDTLAAARGYAELTLESAIWSTAISVREWAAVLQDALAEGIHLSHASRGTQTAQDIVRNNCHDGHHHLWDVKEILGRPTDPRFGA